MFTFCAQFSLIVVPFLTWWQVSFSYQMEAQTWFMHYKRTGQAWSHLQPIWTSNLALREPPVSTESLPHQRLLEFILALGHLFNPHIASEQYMSPFVSGSDWLGLLFSLCKKDVAKQFIVLKWFYLHMVAVIPTRMTKRDNKYGMPAHALGECTILHHGDRSFFLIRWRLRHGSYIITGVGKTQTGAICSPHEPSI